MQHVLQLVHSQRPFLRANKASQNVSKARGCGGARSAQHVGTAQRGTVCRHDYPNHTEALQAWQNPLPGLAGQEEVPWQDSFAVHMDGQVLPPSLSIVKLTV